MTDEGSARRRAWSAPLVCGVVACAVRGVLGVLQYRNNPALGFPTLDAAYYLDWAREIAAGDVLSAGPTGSAGPYLLNPLYAWAMAPVVAWGVPGVLALQAVLGGMTAAVSARTARRLAGGAAGWVAGLAVAFSAALVHLSTHVSVATLAALLVALALDSATSPPRASGTRDAAAVWTGVWLGLGALARPVTLLALPFLAAARTVMGRRRAALTVALVFGVFAALSFARNTLVSGEPVVFTAANGQNLHLGNNRLARTTASMLTDEFRFAPVEMHADARHRVALEIGREPSAVEVSDWYRGRALQSWRDAPADSLRHTLAKAAWFASPAEPPSSADLRVDLERVPWLRAAWVPSWLLLGLGVGGLWLVRRDRALVLAAGGLVAAHWLACTLAFPLSHYRAPALPALAVLAAVLAGRWSAAAFAEKRGATIAVVGVFALAWAVPGAGYPPAVLEHNRFVDALAEHRLDDAEAHAARALTELPGWTAPYADLALVEARRGRFAEAEAWAREAATRRPWVVPERRLLADVLLDGGRRDEALAQMDALVEAFPWSAEARGARGRVRAFAGDLDAARADLDWAMHRGHAPDAETRALVGLPRAAPRRR